MITPKKNSNEDEDGKDGANKIKDRGALPKVPVVPMPSFQTSTPRGAAKVTFEEAEPQSEQENLFNTVSSDIGGNTTDNTGPENEEPPSGERSSHPLETQANKIQKRRIIIPALGDGRGPGKYPPGYQPMRGCPNPASLPTLPTLP